MSIYFKDKASPEDLAKFEQDLKTAPYIKDYKFVHKDSAALDQKEVIGEDFVHFLGFNPLQNSYDIRFNGEYVEKDSIKNIELTFKENDLIEDVVYDQQLIELVNENITKITFWVLIISGVFAFISFLLINSSLRLSVYAKRFIIKTMQMVGATKSFIRKPFIWTSVKLGMIGSVLAIVGVIAVAYYVDSIFPTLEILKDTQSLIIVCGGIFIVGIIISYISTFFATQRFLNLKSDDLY